MIGASRLSAAALRYLHGAAAAVHRPGPQGSAPGRNRLKDSDHGPDNPVAFAFLREGETVLDSGSGRGFDCFLAVNKVGKADKVVGVGMMLEVAERARGNPEKEGTRMLPAHLDYTGRFLPRHCQ